MPGFEDRLKAMRAKQEEGDQHRQEEQEQQRAEALQAERETRQGELAAERERVATEIAAAEVEAQAAEKAVAQAEAFVAKQGDKLDPEAKAEVEAIRAEAAQAVSRLGELTGQLANIDAELQGTEATPTTEAPAVNTTPAETPAEVPTEAAETTAEISAVEQERTRDLTPEETQKLQALQEQVAACREPTDAEKQQIQQLLELKTKLEDLGDKNLLDIAIRSFKDALEDADRAKRPLTEREERLQDAIKYGDTLETNPARVTKDQSPAELLLAAFGQRLETMVQDKALQEREPEGTRLRQERIAALQKLATDIRNTRMAIVHAPDAGKRIIDDARVLKTSLASSENTAQRALEQKVRGEAKSGEAVDTQYLRQLRQLQEDLSGKVGF